jgi:DNA-binding NtrC family response regulator
MADILIVDDEQKIRKILTLLLKSEGYDCVAAESGEQAVLIASEQEFKLILLDMNMSGMDGLETMRALKKIQTNTQFVFITAHGSVKRAVEAIQGGAYNFLEKPFDNDELLGIVQGALEIFKVKEKLRILESQQYAESPFESIIGSSKELMKVLQLTEKIAALDTPILVNGESGTGKELLVRAIHKISARRDKIFIPVNCAAIAANLFESEFFGHKKGSFTGAASNQKGKFLEADNGTLFLDEVGELPLEFQAKLLRVLESGEITPVGGVTPIYTNVRVIAATNKDLEQEVKNGTFREDLFYRLNIFQLKLPALRERRSDIPILAHYFCKKLSNETKISDSALKLLTQADWPGNIRQLKNEMQRAVILADCIIQPENLSFQQVRSNIELKDFYNGFELETEIDSIRKNYYLAAMEHANGKKSQAAQILGVSYRVFKYQLEKYLSNSSK